jgi:hypothetical protein
MASRKLTHPKLAPNSILIGALIDICLASPVIPETCSTHKAAHRNHVWVHVVADDTQICVYDATVATAIPVDVFQALVPTGMITGHCSNVLEGGTMRERRFLPNMN